MTYYVCIGKVDYYSTTSKPKYTLGGPKFNDFFDYFQGYAKTPTELGITSPFPEQYKDNEDRIWVLKSGNKPDNHQFKRKKEIMWQNQTYYKARNKEKYQNPSPKWDSNSSATPSLWQQLKNKGLIK
jgi:hypothetical protein